MDILKKKLNYKFYNSAVVYENTIQSNDNMPIYHFHNLYEIYYIAFGERNFFIGNKVYRAQRGDVIFIKSNMLHRNTEVGSNGYERITFYVEEVLLSIIDRQYNDINIYQLFDGDNIVLRLGKAEQKYIEDILMRIVNNYISDEEVYKVYGQNIIIELLFYLIICIKNNGHFVSNYPNKPYEKISPIITYINKNYKNNMLLISIADKFYTSTSCLTKSFKRATGMTINTYINIYRIEIAKAILKHTDYKIIQVAESVGFNNVSHFSRTFGKIVGISPVKYKNIRWEQLGQ